MNDDIIKELASVFDSEAAAVSLLDKAGIPRGRLPPFGGRTLVQWWEVVDRELKKGLMPSGPAALLGAAAAEYPDNETFQHALSRDRAGSHEEVLGEALQHLDALLVDEFAKCQGEFTEARSELARKLLKPGLLRSTFHSTEIAKIYENDIRAHQQAALDTVRKCLLLFEGPESEIVLREVTTLVTKKLGDHISEREAKSEERGMTGSLPRLNLDRERVLRSVKADLAILCRQLSG